MFATTGHYTNINMPQCTAMTRTTILPIYCTVSLLYVCVSKRDLKKILNAKMAPYSIQWELLFWQIHRILSGCVAYWIWAVVFLSLPLPASSHKFIDFTSWWFQRFLNCVSWLLYSFTNIKVHESKLHNRKTHNRPCLQFGVSFWTSLL